MIAGGIPAAEAYATIKHIKKKHRDKVLAEKEKFLAGFSAYLQEKENADPLLATDVSEKVWKIIEDSSSYLFCCAHAFAYACDSAYGAWLKAHYPYEFYVTMLKLYTEKGDKDKIVAIINEMKRYKQIKLIPGQWKQDNRDWTVDKENNTISQSLSSIKFISQQTAESLYDLSQQKTFWIGTEYKKTKEKDSEGNFIYEETSFTSSFNTFTDVLRAIQMNTGIKKNEIEILIGIGYFKEYGGNGKLLSVFNEFTEGKNKLTKTIKSFNKRLDYLRNYEASLSDAYIDIAQQLLIENDNIGLCLSIFPKAPGRIYFVQEVDDKYGIKVKLYNIHNGNIGVIRIRKNTWAKIPLSVNQCIYIDDYSQEQRYSYKEGRRTPINGEYDIWANVYHILKQEDLKINEI